MKDILRRNNPQYNSIEGLLEKKTLATPIQVSKSTGVASFTSIVIPGHRENPTFGEEKHTIFKARYIKYRSR